MLSRIKLGSDAQGLALLNAEVIAEINRLIASLAIEAGIPRRRIYEAVMAGNTCMLHLAARVDPEPLGRYPYTPTLTGDVHYPARALGLIISPFGLVYFPPVVSGFVGADITAGMLSASLADEKGVTLFVDIGTNGEMVLARDGRLQATSTAAGPAFEGMNIACGMRAARGAIERVSLDGGEVNVRTIDDAPPAGLCGSGLLDAVAELAVHGIIETPAALPKIRGLLPPGLQSRFGERDGKPAFHLTPDIYLSQGDIRQVQLAKGAVRAGVDVLLRRNGLTAARRGPRVDRRVVRLSPDGAQPCRHRTFPAGIRRQGRPMSATLADRRRGLADPCAKPGPLWPGWCARSKRSNWPMTTPSPRVFVAAMAFPHSGRPSRKSGVTGMDTRIPGHPGDRLSGQRQDHFAVCIAAPDRTRALSQSSSTNLARFHWTKH